MPANFEPYFWDHLILQFSHQKSIILDCLVALSAIYEARDSRDASGLAVQPRSVYVLDKYTKALRHRFTYMSSELQDLKVTLICCLIFVWIEYLQNNSEGGLRRLRSGLKILD